jgi:hypothetical protein
MPRDWAFNHLVKAAAPKEHPKKVLIRVLKNPSYFLKSCFTSVCVRLKKKTWVRVFCRNSTTKCQRFSYVSRVVGEMQPGKVPTSAHDLPAVLTQITDAFPIVYQVRLFLTLC